MSNREERRRKEKHFGVVKNYFLNPVSAIADRLRGRERNPEV